MLKCGIYWLSGGACDAGVVGAYQSGSRDRFRWPDWQPGQVAQDLSAFVLRRAGVRAVQTHRHDVPGPRQPRRRPAASKPAQHQGVVLRRSRSNVLRLERLLHPGITNQRCHQFVNFVHSAVNSKKNQTNFAKAESLSRPNSSFVFARW